MREDMEGMSKSSRELERNTILYKYPDGSVDIIVTSGKGFMPAGWEEAGAKPPQGAKRQKGKKSEGEDMARSARRAAAKLRRLALANDFEYFVTLTFDPEKVDSFDAAAVGKILNRWTDNMVRRHGLRYVIAPELHKSGRIHLHGFFAGAGLKVVESGHVDSCGHPVYNLPQWGYGFSTAIRLYGNYHAAVGYCTKYITKLEGQRIMGRWYYSGGTLREPERDMLDAEYRKMVDTYFPIGPRPAGEKWHGQVGAIPGAKILNIRLEGGKNDD